MRLQGRRVPRVSLRAFRGLRVEIQGAFSVWGQFWNDGCLGRVLSAGISDVRPASDSRTQIQFASAVEEDSVFSVMPTATSATPIDRFSLPDAGGHFGCYGGVFVPETLMTALAELGAEADGAEVLQSGLRLCRSTSC